MPIIGRRSNTKIVPDGLVPCSGFSIGSNSVELKRVRNDGYGHGLVPRFWADWNRAAQPGVLRDTVCSWLCSCLVVLLLFLSGVRSAHALDVFTLWRQPEIPINMVEGGWVEYRLQVMAGGRREERLTRVVCLDRGQGTTADSWLVEIVPLVEDGGGMRAVPGEGVHLTISRSLLQRQGTFLDAIVGAVQWQSGVPQKMSVAEMRSDPLVAATLNSDFAPRRVEKKRSTTRVVSGQQLLCDQFVMSASDTMVADLPAGKMIQVSSREIVAAVHPDVPFLGLVYVSERVRAASELDPPSRRFRPPPPKVRVEVMELVGYGRQAKPVLGISD